MKLRHEFVVPAPVEQAWGVLLDIPRIAPCVPGASLDEARDGEYTGTMRLKLGPMVTSFEGTLRLEDVDERARRCVLRAEARDARGQGRASATIASVLAPALDGTRVEVETELRVTGPLAQFGRGAMQDVAAKLMDQFAECLSGELSAVPKGTRPTVANEALDVLETSRHAVLRRVAPAAAALAALAIGVPLLRRRRRGRRGR